MNYSGIRRNLNPARIAMELQESGVPSDQIANIVESAYMHPGRIIENNGYRFQFLNEEEKFSDNGSAADRMIDRIVEGEDADAVVGDSGITNANNVGDSEVSQIAEDLSIDFSKVEFTVEDLKKGILVELEHGTKNPATNITNDDSTMTAKIALAHLNEIPTYYDLLAKMEADAKKSKKEWTEDEEPVGDAIVPTMNEVIQFFVENPNPVDEVLHNWCEDNGYTTPAVESMVYKLATAYATNSEIEGE